MRYRGIWVIGLLLAVGATVGMTRLATGAKSLRDFGAVADGTADDTTAIQTAVDSGQGSIHFPKGIYRITKPIEVNLDKVGYTAFTADGTATLKMDGPGPAIRFLGTHGGTASPPSVKPEVWDRQRTPRVDGLEIIGSHAEADGIEANGTMKLSLHGVTLRKLRHGVHLVQRNRNVLISACHIYENSGIGVFYDNVNLHQSNIVGCHISYCDQGGVVCKGGEVRNLHIGTCDIEGCMSKTGPPSANVFIDCTGGSTAEVAITGCTIQHSNVPDAANVRILGLGAGIKKGVQSQWGHVTIGDNVFSDVAVNVDIRDSRGVTISGNTFWMGYQYNLRVENSEQIVVGPNAFERNPAYDYGTSKETKNAVLFKNCRDCTLNALHIQGVRSSDAALSLDTCRRFNVTACSILDCEGVGLLMKDVELSRVSDCLIRHDGENAKDAVSLRVNGGRENLFADNVYGNAVDAPKIAK